MRLFMWSFVFLGFVFCEAKLEDHFKKIESKSDVHKIRNIDFIYMINLDVRPEKYQMSIEQLDPYGIYPYRFSAVNGWELSVETISDVGVKYAPEMEGGFMATSYLLDGNLEQHHELISNYGQTYFCHCLGRGAIGIALSHLSILQDAYDSGYETIWVMEDDIEIVQDPRIVSDLIDKLDQLVGRNWDVLFTDRDFRNNEGEYVPCYKAAKRPNFDPDKPNPYLLRRKIGNDFRLIGARFGATSMIIRRSGMEKILHFFKEHNIYLPYDMDFYLPEGIKLYTVLQDVIRNKADALSDNGKQNYLNKTSEASLLEESFSEKFSKKSNQNL